MGEKEKGGVEMGARLYWIRLLTAVCALLMPAAAGAFAWNDANLPLSYRVNVVRLPEDLQRVATVQMRLGLEDWISVEGSRLTSCFLGTTSNFGKTTEKILAMWAPLPAGLGGFAMYPPVGLIWYNSSNRALVSYRNIFLHENGHAIGFPHYFSSHSVMAYRGISHLTDFDKSLVRSAYGGEKMEFDKGLCSTGIDTSWFHDPRLKAPK